MTPFYKFFYFIKLRLKLKKTSPDNEKFFSVLVYFLIIEHGFKEHKRRKIMHFAQGVV